jgi:hypothetical protein
MQLEETRQPECVNSVTPGHCWISHSVKEEDLTELSQAKDSTAAGVISKLQLKITKLFSEFVTISVQTVFG